MHLTINKVNSTKIKDEHEICKKIKLTNEIIRKI